MEKAIVMIDAGFLSKVSFKLGEGHYFKYDLLKFSKKLSGKEGFIFKHLFFYNAPPFQSSVPTQSERKRKEEYDTFIRKLRGFGDDVTIREGRCQRLKIDGKYQYKQKGVDTLLTMDLMDLPIQNPKIKKVILIASDTDFVPVVERIQSLGIEVVLYTFFERDRRSIFSTSNKLLKTVSHYVKLRSSDFLECKF